MTDENWNTSALSSWPDNGRVGIETDGGRTGRDEHAAEFSTYTNDEYRYSLAYPDNWSVEPDPDGGTAFEGPAAGAAVFVKESGGMTPETSTAVFLDELDADKHVHALEVVAQRDTQLPSGQSARVVECIYTSDSCEQWRLLYLFVHTDDTDYIVGIDWNETTKFDTPATAMAESFTLKAT